MLEPLALACTPHVDSGEDHGQLSRLEFDAVASGGARHLEGSSLKSLVPDGQPVTIKIEDLDPISATVEEEEEMAGQEVLAKALLDQIRKGRQNPCAYRSVSCKGTRARPRRLEGASITSSSVAAEPAGRVDGDAKQFGIDGALEPHDAGIGQLDLQLPVWPGIEHRDRQEGGSARHRCLVA